MFRLLKYGYILLSPFFVHLQARLDSWLVDEAAPAAPEEEKKKGLPTWLLIVIIVVVVICLGGVCLTILGPIIFGPAIGNVFSNIIEEME